MTDWPILSTVTFLPLVGAFLILLIRDEGEAARRNIRNVALLTTTFTFVLSLFIWIGFDNNYAGFQFVEKMAWLDSGISYHMGVDGISMLFVILTTFLLPLLRVAKLDLVQIPRAGIHDRVSFDSWKPDDRRVLRAGFWSFSIVFLRGEPDPMLSSSGRCSWQAPVSKPRSNSSFLLRSSGSG